MSNRGEYDNDLRTEPAPLTEEQRYAGLRIKTSAAATFALVFGLSSLYAGLTAVLFPLAILFGIIGIILGIAGINYAKRPGVTGGSLAVAGLILAIIGLLIGIAVVVLGATFSDEIQNFYNNRAR